MKEQQSAAPVLVEVKNLVKHFPIRRGLLAAPVGAELVAEHDSRHHAHRERDGEYPRYRVA